MSATYDTGGETTIVCSPGDDLEQARYWYRLVRTYSTEMTMRGFWAAAAELTRAHGPEARTLIKEARRIRREWEKGRHKSLVLTLRSMEKNGTSHRVLLLGHEDGWPIVRGYTKRSGSLCRCPWCGNAEQHPANWTDAQVMVNCKIHEELAYFVRFERNPLLIPCCIPTREGR